MFNNFYHVNVSAKKKDNVLQKKIITPGGKIQLNHSQLPDMPSSVNRDHDGRYFPRTVHINVYNGNSNIPVVTNSDGYIDVTLIEGTSKIVVKCINNTGTTIAANKVVALLGYDETENLPEIVLADRTDNTQINCVFGLTSNAVDDADTVKVIVEGTIYNNTWSYDTSKPLFLDTNGNITQTSPTSGFVIVLGKVVDVSSISFRTMFPIIL